VSEFKLKCDFSRNFNVYAVNIMNMIIKCCSKHYYYHYYYYYYW